MEPISTKPINVIDFSSSSSSESETDIYEQLLNYPADTKDSIILVPPWDSIKIRDVIDFYYFLIRNL